MGAHALQRGLKPSDVREDSQKNLGVLGNDRWHLMHCLLAIELVPGRAIGVPCGAAIGTRSVVVWAVLAVNQIASVVRLPAAQFARNQRWQRIQQIPGGAVV